MGAKERLCDFCPGEKQMPAVDARAQAGTRANLGFWSPQMAEVEGPKGERLSFRWSLEEAQVSACEAFLRRGCRSWEPSGPLGAR